MPASVAIENVASAPKVEVEETFEWWCELVAAKRQPLLTALHIHFLKSNGELAREVFNVKEATVEKGERLKVENPSAMPWQRPGARLGTRRCPPFPDRPSQSSPRPII